MHKKLALVSHPSDALTIRSTRRILLARETIRTLTSHELSQAAGGEGVGDKVNCPCGSTTSSTTNY